ncbi:MAG: acyl-CoA dehydrogenase [Nocardioides sp.]|nr:acyl-CoA dehydrogenase [Nocardioides sp.]
MTDLLYSADDQDLRDAVRGSLARVLDHDRVAALYDDPGADVSAAWRAVASDLGLAALLVPEHLGGAGATAREAAVVAEELGRAVAPVPFLTSSVVATTVLVHAAQAGSQEAADALGGLADGTSTAALVLPWTARAGTRTTYDGGPVRPVAGAVGADLLLVPRADGLHLVPAADAEVTPLTSLDMSRPVATVEVGGEGVLLADSEQAAVYVDAGLVAGAALLASEQLGVAQWCLETTVAYVGTRVQFARPIGSFQAVKHRLADLYLEVVQAQAAARWAAAALAEGDPDLPVAVATAQSWCSEVALHAAEEAVQLHGGIGMTWEHPVHLYLKRAKADQLALGTPAAHRSDLGVLVDLVP